MLLQFTGILALGVGDALVNPYTFMYCHNSSDAYLWN
jgi:hypothetical protein